MTAARLWMAVAVAVNLAGAQAQASSAIDRGMARIDAWTVEATVDVMVRRICGLGGGGERFITDRRWKAVAALYDGRPPQDKLAGRYLINEINRRASAIAGGTDGRNCPSIRKRAWSM